MAFQALYNVQDVLHKLTLLDLQVHNRQLSSRTLVGYAGTAVLLLSLAVLLCTYTCSLDQHYQQQLQTLHQNICSNFQVMHAS